MAPELVPIDIHDLTIPYLSSVATARRGLAFRVHYADEGECAPDAELVWVQNGGFAAVSDGNETLWTSCSGPDDAARRYLWSRCAQLARQHRSERRPGRLHRRHRRPNVA